MTTTPSDAILALDDLDVLVAALVAYGYRVVGPTERDGAIVLAELGSAGDLPIGRRDVQEPGGYRLEDRDDERRFGFMVGPQSYKRELYPPVLTLYRARRDAEQGFVVEPEAPAPRPLAVFGARACDVAAMAIQDRVLTGGTHVDADYAARRAETFVVAVDCPESGSSCFCVSMGTGPHAESGFDLRLTELVDAAGHRFLVAAGSPRGAAVLATLPTLPAAATDVAARADQREHAVATQTRALPDPAGVHDLLLANLDHPRFAETADRCLSCGNCTMVCPTCFCVAVEDHTDLTGAEATRTRVWDSCFTVGYSHIHGGSVRPSGRSRYRQWLTHKLATWQDQFDESGCVGCGRCITWCPVGIDLTAEVAAIAADDRRTGSP
jgi:ferredoxin